MCAFHKYCFFCFFLIASCLLGSPSNAQVAISGAAISSDPAFIAFQMGQSQLKHYSPMLLPNLFTNLLDNNQPARAIYPYHRIVNPFIGTGGHGHTFPGACAPFGMVQVSPDTHLDGWDGCSGYHYTDSVVYGFSHTHLSGTGCSDYGDILLMPVMGEPQFDPKKYSSHFSHKREQAYAGFYSVHLDDENIDVALTAGLRTGMHAYRCNQSGKLSVMLDLLHRDRLLNGKIKVINNHTVVGFRCSKAWAEDQRVYFRIEFSKPFVKDSILSSDTLQTKGGFVFNMQKGDSLIVKVSLSAVDETGAEGNMNHDARDFNFNKFLIENEWRWCKELNKIQVKGGSDDEMVIFYTALYHCFIQPNLYNDADGRYLGRDFKVHVADSFNYYTVFSLWDTFRAAHPLYNLVQQDLSLDFIKTFLRQYQEGGRLPVWELSSNETDCMIGYHSVSVIADAYAKGITDFDLQLAREAMKVSANRDQLGLPAYRTNGFIGLEDEPESVSKALEYAYDDWCIAQLCEGRDKAEFLKRSQCWRNYLDPETGMMRPRVNGGFLTPFNPAEVSNHFTEANAWQYSFFVPQDVPGLIQAHGGATAFEAKLDALFQADTKLAGRDQPDITGLIGQYAHGNEPSHHMAYLYNLAGNPGKTQAMVNRIRSEMYHNAPDGLAGNEDCGQMSAWYVMSALGLYAVCPGSDQYALTTPLFQQASLHLGSNDYLTIKRNGTAKTIYSDMVKINGKHLNSFSVHHNQLLGNATLLFSSATIPPAKLLVQPAKPTAYLCAPVISVGKQPFEDSTLVQLTALGNQSQSGLRYRINGGTPQAYTKPFYLHDACTIEALVNDNSSGEENHSTASIYKVPNHWIASLATAFSPSYHAGGKQAVVDGLHGTENWRVGNWQGFWGKDFEVVIDMLEPKELHQLSTGFLQDSRAWILFPKDVAYAWSMDGQHFTEPMLVKNEVDPAETKTTVQQLSIQLPNPIKARYIKVHATNFGTLPAWHQGAGGQAYIFVDEVEVK